MKDCDETPTDKVLISKNAYARLKLQGAKSTAGSLAYCNLRNVAGGQRQQVRKLTVFDASARGASRPLKRIKLTPKLTARVRYLLRQR